MPSPQVVLSVTDVSQVGEVRRAAARLAELLQFSEEDKGRVAIVTTELANNLLQHGKGGDVFLSIVQESNGEGVELLVSDRGPGMADVVKCLTDGYSTGGTPGTGLGAASRLADVFDIYSEVAKGTVVAARCFKRGTTKSKSLSTGAISKPIKGEVVCGDSWAKAERDGVIALIVADGSGHGGFAAEASLAALRVFDADPFRPPGTIVGDAHKALRSTRGASVAVARLDIEQSSLKYAAVGNIAGRIDSVEKSTGLLTHNGIVGAQMRKLQEIEYPWRNGDLLAMHSDGLQTRWTLNSYFGLRSRHPAVISGILFRDFARGHDDATVVIVS